MSDDEIPNPVGQTLPSFALPLVSLQAGGGLAWQKEVADDVQRAAFAGVTGDMDGRAKPRQHEVALLTLGTSS